MVRRGFVLFIACGVATLAAATEKPAQFWNLTSSTVTSLRLAKAGTDAFGPNLTLNDPDGAVEHDERLKLPGVASGAYDVKLTLKNGNACSARNVVIAIGRPFSLEDKALQECRKEK